MPRALAWLALVFAVATKRRSLGALGWFSAVFTPIVGTHEVFRLAYYGAPLPNTFYAKVSGAWWSQGFDYLWFFATPVIYSYAAIPEGSPLRQVLRLNPMTHVMVTYQQMLFHGNVDHWRGLFLALLVGILAFAAGASRSRPKIVDSVCAFDR